MAEPLPSENATVAIEIHYRSQDLIAINIANLLSTIMEFLENSPRVSTEEEDLVQHSTKKVKTYDEMDLNKPSDDMEIPHENTENAVVRPKATIKTLDGGWALFNCPTLEAFFLESEKAVCKIAAWIRIPNLPIELYNHRFLWRVGLAIGTMLKIDRAMSIHSRGRFAKICIEIDLTKKLVPKISVFWSIFNIEYEDLHLICFKWSLYGHRSEQCSELSEDVEEGGGVLGSGGDGQIRLTEYHCIE
ncbi:hypothetical protein Ahy_B04g073494 [Arachis hypogaea]|uniref:Uncharacterized protein n=1 Tax=Arachis hypogaea TaxID=3818 RepID=A0A444ZQM3_ARAHY|nr:hypothetical protein Ahy_B04g073494 [Arachis hypogaea]